MEKAEKISVSDLSVGDLVCAEQLCGVHSEPRLTPPMKVVGLGESWVNLEIDPEQGDPFEFEPSEIRGVPITAKVLEKNGWSEFSDYHNSWKLDVASDKRVWMFKNSHDWTFQVMSWGLGYNHSVAKAYIKDIHELQRALRLAKVGKEIVL